MNLKLRLCLALFLMGGFILSRATETNAVTAANSGGFGSGNPQGGVVISPAIIEDWKAENIMLLVPGNSALHSRCVTNVIPVRRAIFDSGKVAFGPFSILEVHDSNAKQFYLIDGNHSFYVSGRDNLTGFTVGPGVLVWSTNYLRLPDSSSTYSLISLFEEQFDGDKIRQESLKRLNDRISLQPAVPRFWFSDGPNPGGASVRLDIKSVEVNDAVMRLEIRNPSTRKSATIWLDLHGKKVLRSIVDGQEMDVGENFATPSRTNK
jgi:hypothetical protein